MTSSCRLNDGSRSYPAPQSRETTAICGWAASHASTVPGFRSVCRSIIWRRPKSHTPVPYGWPRLHAKQATPMTRRSPPSVCARRCSTRGRASLLTDRLGVAAPGSAASRILCARFDRTLTRRPCRRPSDEAADPTCCRGAARSLAGAGSHADRTVPSARRITPARFDQ